MKEIAIGSTVPKLTFESTDPSLRSFDDLLGQPFILYFYPKDNTPGCTTESKDFRDLTPTLAKFNTRIIGVSKDSMSSHHKFCEKYSLPFALISDPDQKLCRSFNVIREKNMFARIVLGIERSTFLIDSKGVVRAIWRKVKVQGHSQEVLEAVKQLTKENA